MKEKLKYLVAVLLAGSLGLWFMPLIRVAITEFSLMDILKAGLGNYGRSGVIKEIVESVSQLLEPYILAMFGGVAILLMGAFLTAVLRGKKAYIAALISSVMNNIAAVSICLIIKEQMNGLAESISLFDVAELFHFNYTVIFMWTGLYALILILTVCGIKMWRKPEQEEPAEDILPEQFHVDENPWKVQEQIEKPAVLNKPEIQKKQPVQKAAAEFYGAVTGETGVFKDKVYLLEEDTAVFFQYKAGHPAVSPYREEESLARIHFVKESQEYCVKPLEYRSFFLESGQPLGKNRYYYLPRGTRFYIVEEKNIFTAA